MDFRKTLYLNVSFYTLFLLFSVAAIPVLTLVVLLSAFFISRRKTMKLFRRFIRIYGQAVTSLPYPLIKLDYQECPENQAGGPYIFVCNHRSACDPFLMCCLPYEAVQVVNKWPFRLPVLGSMARLADYIDINNISYEEFMEKSGKLLEEGVSLIFFPEGTRSPDKKMNSFHSSAFRLALESKVPVVPLCLSGNELTPPKGTLRLEPSTVSVKMLPAVKWKNFKSLNAYAFKNQVRKLIENELGKMDAAGAQAA